VELAAEPPAALPPLQFHFALEPEPYTKPCHSVSVEILKATKALLDFFEATLFPSVGFEKGSRHLFGNELRAKLRFEPTSWTAKVIKPVRTAVMTDMIMVVSIAHNVRKLDLPRECHCTTHFSTTKFTVRVVSSAYWHTSGRRWVEATGPAEVCISFRNASCRCTALPASTALPAKEIQLKGPLAGRRMVGQTDWADAVLLETSYSIG
jgi:hypothetical protein